MDTSTGSSADLREEVVVSICLPDVPNTAAAISAVASVARQVDKAYKFREIILVAEENEHEAFLGLLDDIPNIRLFAVHESSGHYDRRLLAAEESIGDVVLIGAYRELEILDYVSLLARAEAENALVLPTSAQHRTLLSYLATPIYALGRMAGFNVNFNDLQTIAVPRSDLNYILDHSEPRLATRFPPRDPRLSIIFEEIRQRKSAANLFKNTRRRLELLKTLLTHLAPKVLTAVAVLSVILACFGLGFGIYASINWIVQDDLAEGWLTTSLMLGLTSLFLGLSMLGISLGVLQILSESQRDHRSRFAREINHVDLFEDVKGHRNVELSAEDDFPCPQ